LDPKIINKLCLSAGFLIAIGLIFFNANNAFFWDTVQLASAHANYYYTTHFSHLLVPADIDSGHIPTFGIYLAMVWELFGRSLPSSHLSMLPFAVGIVWQLYQLCARLISPQYVGIAMLMVLIDPSLLSQMTLVSPDVALLFFFLLGINAVLKDKKWLLSLCIVLLFLTSMRGMMVSICVLSLDLYCHIDFRKKIIKITTALLKRSIIYWPAMSIFMLFSVYHYMETGWIGYHKDSPWAACFIAVDAKGFLFNIGLLIWRIIDFGRIGIWLVFLVLFVIYKKQLFTGRQNRLLMFFSILILLLLPANMLWAQNLLAHRYLIPIYIVISLSCAALLFSDIVSTKLKYILSAIWFVSLISGNFWIYPPKISEGWDSTLAHHPYYALRTEAISYLDNQKIDFNKVQSFFPNTATLDRIDLNDDHRNLDTFDGTGDYIFYSNIYNCDDPTYDLIMDKSKYTMLKRFENNGVFINIHQKNR
jgi:hypothetical protein